MQQVILYTSIVYSIAFISVVLRIAGKAVSQRLAWDDAMVVAALFLTAIPLGCVLDMSQKGFGEHLWNLEDGKLLPILRNCRSLLATPTMKTNDCQCIFPGRHTLSSYA